MRHRLAVHKADIAGGRDHVRQFQIVMRLKMRPPSPVGFADLQLDLGSSPKIPPGERTRCRFIDPVRIEPVNDVIMAGQQNRPATRSPPRLAKGQRTNPGNLPIDHTGELIDNDFGRLFADDPGKLCPELLAIGQHMEAAASGHRPSPTAANAAVTSSKARSGAMASMIG